MNWNQIKESLLHFLGTTGIRVIVAVVLLLILWKLVNRITQKLKQGKKFKSIDPLLRNFLVGFLSIGLKILLLVTFVAYLGLPTSSIIAAIASCGVAIGLALQGGLSNLAGGLMLLFIKPFQIGDEVSVGDYQGYIREIGIFYTSVITYDNRHVYLPNGSLISGTIVNHTAEPTRRVDIVASVSYDADPEKVKAALLSLAKDERVLAEPLPQLIVSGYRDSAVEYTLRLWCKAADYWGVQNDSNEKLKPALDQAGVSIPYPQLDVHMKPLK